MKKIKSLLIFALLVIISLTWVIGCNSIGKLENEFILEQFENEMKSKGYKYKRQDLQEALFTPISQYMMLDNIITIDDTQYVFYDTDVIIYSYENNEEMEKEASTLNKEASQITREGDMVGIEWSNKTPHFYKKGKIIVQYIGDDEKIVNDLKEIMGEQFAGR